MGFSSRPPKGNAEVGSALGACSGPPGQAGPCVLCVTSSVFFLLPRYVPGNKCIGLIEFYARNL